MRGLCRIRATNKRTECLTLPLVQLAEPLPLVLSHQSGMDEMLEAGEASAEPPADCPEGDAVGERDVADDGAPQDASSHRPGLLCGVQACSG